MWREFVPVGWCPLHPIGLIQSVKGRPASPPPLPMPIPAERKTGTGKGKGREHREASSQSFANCQANCAGRLNGTAACARSSANNWKNEIILREHEFSKLIYHRYYRFALDFIRVGIKERKGMKMPSNIKSNQILCGCIIY